MRLTCLRRASALMLVPSVLLTSCGEPKPERQGQVRTPGELSLATVSNLITMGMSFQMLTQRLGAPLEIDNIGGEEFAFAYDFAEFASSKDKSEAATGVYVRVLSNKVEEVMVIWMPLDSPPETPPSRIHEESQSSSEFSPLRRVTVKMWALSESGDPNTPFRHPVVEGNCHTNQPPDVSSNASSIRFESASQNGEFTLYAHIDLDSDSRAAISDLVGDKVGSMMVISVDGHLIGAGRLVSPVNAGSLVFPVQLEALDLESKNWVGESTKK